MTKENGSDSIIIAVFGSGGVGKSALTLQFMYNEFVEEYEPTKSDSYKRTIEVDGKEYQVSIFDTAGQEDYEFLKDQFILSSNGFLCVFSVADEESFKKMDEFIEKIIRIKGPENTPVILVGNKIDIAEDEPSRREVTVEDAKEKADKYLIQYMETSAKTKHNVIEVFQAIGRQVISTKVPQETVKMEKKKSKRRFWCC
ncbi:Ras-related protein O-RAL [Thelohanellus kitauei]|uniref:Ras-related protein O-RAL n=1 Tax=Thelohanellus kitauei TaxID=669202 RepID=A0A0C2JT59_THEKT|nr:Ras-related protein O-RAL [Thelohanellus kitauei]